MNDIQYVYDAAGHKRSVIIPVELWEKTLQGCRTRIMYPAIRRSTMGYTGTG